MRTEHSDALYLWRTTKGLLYSRQVWVFGCSLWVTERYREPDTEREREIEGQTQTERERQTESFQAGAADPEQAASAFLVLFSGLHLHLECTDARRNQEGHRKHSFGGGYGRQGQQVMGPLSLSLSLTHTHPLLLSPPNNNNVTITRLTHSPYTTKIGRRCYTTKYFYLFYAALSAGYLLENS